MTSTGELVDFDFGAFNIADPNRSTPHFANLSDFNSACLSTSGCFLGERDWMCLNSSLMYPAQDLILLDGSDFFDIAYDRYRVSVDVHVRLIASPDSQ